MATDITEEEFSAKLKAMMEGKLNDNDVQTISFICEGVEVHIENLEAKGEKIHAKLIGEVLSRFKGYYENCIYMQERIRSAEEKHKTDEDLIRTGAQLLTELNEELKAVQYENYKMVDQLTAAQVATDTITHDLKMEIDRLNERVKELGFMLENARFHAEANRGQDW